MSTFYNTKVFIICRPNPCWLINRVWREFVVITLLEMSVKEQNKTTTKDKKKQK